MTLGEKLARLRREKNYTQEQLAELLGVSRQSVSKWESDVSYPETEKLLRLGELYGCSMDYLLKNHEEGTAAVPQETNLSGVCFGWRTSLLISAVTCFFLILAAEILRAIATDPTVMTWIRLALLAMAVILFVLCLIRSSAILAALGSGTVLLLSAVQLVGGFFIDQYVIEWTEASNYYHWSESGGDNLYHIYTYQQTEAAYVLPYLLETVACALLFLYVLCRAVPDGGKRFGERMARLWFLPWSVEVAALVLGLLMDSSLSPNESWLGGYRFFMEISIVECLLFITFQLLLCRGLMGKRNGAKG